jgi:hypothetical protein
MRRALVLLIVFAGCHRSRHQPEAAPLPPPPPQPKRIAAADADLREMVAEVAASKACTMMRGRFLPLFDAKDPTTYNGMLWMHDCRITQQGTRLRFELTSDGWQWVDQQTPKAGGTFAVKQYVKFHVVTSVPGELDIGYAPSTHVASFWFTPEHVPDVRFTPIGGIAVDERGAWSSVVGAVGSLLGNGPGTQAQGQARAQGTDEFQRTLGTGLSATIDLCSGLMRFGLGRPPRGQMVPPLPGDSTRVAVVLEPGGVMIFGPYPAPHGMTVHADARTGAFRLALVCDADAQRIAGAFVAGQPAPASRALAQRTIAPREHVTLVAKPASCPIAVVASSMGPTAPSVIFDWQRPPREAAAALGGPIADCARPRP